MEYYSAIKNKNIMDYKDKYKKLENIIPSEVMHTQKNLHGMYSLMSTKSSEYP